MLPLEDDLQHDVNMWRSPMFHILQALMVQRQYTEQFEPTSVEKWNLGLLVEVWYGSEIKMGKRGKCDSQIWMSQCETNCEWSEMTDCSICVEI
jgi:hypothetical protein